MESLGCLYVFDCIVIPPVLFTLRSVIHRTYLQGGRALARVREALVVFFSKQPVNERRAEELPWLLERLQNWQALKVVLLDLSMFELLWSERLKSDILRYWSILSGADWRFSSCRLARQ
jgi:hypothetical protein